MKSWFNWLALTLSATIAAVLAAWIIAAMTAHGLMLTQPSPKLAAMGEWLSAQLTWQNGLMLGAILGAILAYAFRHKIPWEVSIRRVPQTQTPSQAEDMPSKFGPAKHFDGDHFHALPIESAFVPSRIENVYLRHANGEVESFNVTANGRKVLAVIKDSGFITMLMTKVAEQLGWSMEHCQSVVGFLKKSGFVDISEGLLGRHVTLTAKGQQYVERMKRRA